MPLRVLLAEDSPTNQLLTVLRLEQIGWVVEVVEDGQEAVQVLDEKDFDLILMDVFMPRMDGLEATRTIRRREQVDGRWVPIVGMTATDTLEHRDRCMEAGMDSLVTKPLNVDELRTVVTPLLAGSCDSRVMSTARCLPINLDEALEAVDGDYELLRDVINLFSEEHPRHVALLKEVLSRRDAGEVERVAHKLRGILGNVGATMACELAQQLEAMGERGHFEDATTVLAKLEEEIARVMHYLATLALDQPDNDK